MWIVLDLPFTLRSDDALFFKTKFYLCFVKMSSDQFRSVVSLWFGVLFGSRFSPVRPFPISHVCISCFIVSHSWLGSDVFHLVFSVMGAPPCSGLSVWGLLLSSPRGSPAGHVSPTLLPASSSPRPPGLGRLQVSSLLDAPNSPHSQDRPGCDLQAPGGQPLLPPSLGPCPSLCVCVLLGPLRDGGSCLHEVSPVTGRPAHPDLPGSLLGSARNTCWDALSPRWVGQAAGLVLGQLSLETDSVGRGRRGPSWFSGEPLAWRL